jgi:hypothetical protein
MDTPEGRQHIKSAWPLTQLKTHDDWANYHTLLQQLVQFATERKARIENAEKDRISRGAPELSDREKRREVSNDAATIYHTINASNVFSLEGLDFPLKHYISLIHPSSVQHALVRGAARAREENRPFLTTEQGEAVSSWSTELFQGKPFSGVQRRSCPNSST